VNWRTFLLIAVLAVTLSAGGVAVVAAGGSGIETTAGDHGQSVETNESLTTGTHTDPPADALVAHGEEVDGLDDDSIDGVANHGAAETVQGDPTDGIELDVALSQRPDRTGEVGVELQYRVPERLASLDVRLFDEANVEEADGFTEGEDGRYVWDGSTERPTIRYTMSVNQQLEQDGPIAGPGTYIFADTEDWTVMAQPRLSHSWGWRGGGPVGLERSTSIDGPGASGDRIAFLGEQTTHTHEAHGQQFDLVVPEAADLAEEPDEIFASVSHASEAMQVGSRDDEVFMLAVPTGEVRWGVRGLQTGAADLWVRDNEVLDTADNVWVHEYVHTRQGYQADPDARWFTEATATYYAALLTLEEDRIEFSEFQARLDAGTHERHADAVLTDPDSWARGTDYNKGALAAGEIDRQLRLETDGGASLQDPFGRMNEASEPVDSDAFLDYVDSAGGEEPRETARRLTTTSETAAVWSGDEHAAAFGTSPARIGYSLPDDADGIRVEGEYRDRSIGDEDPITVVTGERLTIDGIVENTGDSAGNYEARLRVDGQIVDRTTGRLDPGERTTAEVSHRFDEQGERTVAFGDDQRRVIVEEPATARVTDVTRSPGRVTPGEDVTVSATVTNDNPLPGRADVQIRTGGETIEETTVYLDADGETTVTATHRFDETGTQRITVDDGTGDQTVSVRVIEGGVAGLIAALGDGSLGVGVLSVLVVVALLGASSYVFRAGR